MKVLVVNFAMDPAAGGGTASKSVSLCRALTRAGVEATLLTTDVGLGGSAPPDRAGLEAVVVRGVFRRYTIPLVAPGRVARLAEAADLVFVLNHWQALNALAYVAARRAGRPYVLCPAGALTAAGRSQPLKRLFTRAVGARMIRDAHTIIATTSLEAARLEARGIPRSRIAVIPNGIEIPPGPVEPRTALDAPAGPGDAPFVLFLGRLNRVKGPDLLLEAFGRMASRLPPWHLVFAGPDEGLLSELRARTDALGLSGRVHFPGYLTPARAQAVCRAAALLAVPSREEAMSLVALEAGAAGTPVLLTDTCGFEEVEQAGGGRVVPAGVDALAAGLADLLHDPARLRAMGDRLRTLVRDRFGWDGVAQRYVELFESVLRRQAVEGRR